MLTPTAHIARYISLPGAMDRTMDSLKSRSKMSSGKKEQFMGVTYYVESLIMFE